MFVYNNLGIFAELPYFFAKSQSLTDPIITGEYSPAKSLRFRRSNSTYLNRTPSVTGNRKVWTWSGWIKRASLGTTQYIHSSFNAGTNECAIRFNTDDTLEIEQYTSPSYNYRLVTTQVFRDLGGWFHLVVAVDTTQLLESSRIRVFINGLEIKNFSAIIYPTRNFDTNFNLVSYTNQIGAWNTSAFFDGNMTNIYFVDGESLSPFNFGEIDFLTGVWKPKTYTTFFGTNGFYLPFNDNTNTTTLGYDKSNSTTNHWTTNNISLINGSTFDSMIDMPTSNSAIPYYSGWNPNYGLQFRSSSKTHLIRTLPTGTNNRKWTWSAWVKRSSITATTQILFSREVISGSTEEYLAFSDNHTLSHHDGNTGVSQTITTNTFTDTSIWYHIVYIYDSNATIVADKGIFYVNNVRQTSSATNISNSRQSNINTSGNHSIGKWYADIGGGFNGVMAEINFIDGQALTPSSFGETDSNGRWIPKTYTGTYGTNGFYLNFADRTFMSSTYIGNDASPNSNHWTPTNMIGSDSINYSTSIVTGNYPTLNPLAQSSGTFSNGNLEYTGPGSWKLAPCTMMIPKSGKWYFEGTLKAAPLNGTFNAAYAGLIIINPEDVSSWSLWTAGNFVGVTDTGVYINYSSTANGSFSVPIIGTTLGISIDRDTNTVSIYRNGGLITTLTAGAPAKSDLIFAYADYNGTNGSMRINFGQYPFAYGLPTGCSALNTNNIPTPVIQNPANYMAATTYTGVSSTKIINNSVNGGSFQPNLIWNKSRTDTSFHYLIDSVRGPTSAIHSNNAAISSTITTTTVNFDLSGVSFNGPESGLNANGRDYVSWQWKEGVTPGLDIVTYAGSLTTTGRVSVAHNLSAVPTFIISKSLNVVGPDDVGNWFVWHASAGVDSFFRLNLPQGADSTVSSGGGTMLSATSAVFYRTWNSGSSVAGNNYVAYVFAEVEGFSKFGKYTGNGSDNGPFVYCGFKPKFVMIKRRDASASWVVFDSSRNTGNLTNLGLVPNDPAVEFTGVGTVLDILSNGIKPRGAGAEVNVLNGTYIFAAFAETPSKYALAESSVNLNKAPENIATNSLRFRSSASANLSRTPSSAGNRTTWTWSGWVKRGLLNSSHTIFSAGTSANTKIAFEANTATNGDSIRVFDWTGTVFNGHKITTSLFRDPSAWYHVVVSWNTLEPGDDRIKIYVNGIRITSFSTNVNPGTGSTSVNNNVLHRIGQRADAASGFFDGYLTEVNLIDGQALTPTAFGEIDSVTGVWTPRRYTGSYGTNGFYLKFGNTASLGEDSSGKGNNWTPNNFSTTLGATYDVMTDVPVNYDDGRNGRGNYATWNSLMPADFKGSMVISDGNLKAAGVNTAAFIVSNMGFNSSSGQKYYAEFLVLSDGTQYKEVYLGIRSETSNNWYFSRSGIIVLDGTTITTGATYTTNDLIGIAVDTSANTVSYYKNNIFQGSSNIPAESKNWRFLFYSNGTNNNQSSSVAANFGQRPFAYTPPAGFKALNTNNLPTPTIINPAEYMAATTYTGTGSAQRVRNNVNNVSFKPDLIWIKNMSKANSTAYAHALFDSVRGINANGSPYITNDPLIENGLNSGFGVNALNDNGFSLISSGTLTNTLNDNYIAWQWRALNSTTTNTLGTITSQVNANPTAGFSIISYTGTGVAGTIGHGLSSAPSFVILKARTLSTENLNVWHSGLGSTRVATRFQLNTNLADSGDGSSVWNTVPNLSVFGVGILDASNKFNSTYIAYCFSEISGFSKFGSYSGIGSVVGSIDGPFIYTGFRPAFVMVKRAEASGHWYLWDATRVTTNPISEALYPNLNSLPTGSGGIIDFLSNGFKLRYCAADYCFAGGTYLYVAFAETPVKYALAR